VTHVYPGLGRCVSRKQRQGRERDDTHDEVGVAIGQHRGFTHQGGVDAAVGLHQAADARAMMLK